MIVLILAACAATNPADDSGMADTATTDDTAPSDVPYIECSIETASHGLYDEWSGSVWAGFAPRYSELNGAIFGPTEGGHRYVVTTRILYDETWQDSPTDLVEVEQDNGDPAVWIGAAPIVTGPTHIFGCEITLTPA